ncbi:MAG: porin [Rhodospirillales bacterium]|nr:porin [Rhodospirillales bacterium]
MKKLLLSSVALCGLTFAMPAMAGDGVKLELGGYYQGYLAYIDQDTAAGSKERNLDWLQNTEIHFNGETTLDNGLTVGFHAEGEADNNDAMEIEESYAYFSGAWGRVNAGAENGAVYLLQVAAPSADSNVDGIRQLINPFNYALTDMGALDNAYAANGVIIDVAGGASGDVRAISALSGGVPGDSLFSTDYDDDISGYANKLTYMTPVFSGVQLGASYTPKNDSDGNRSSNGVHSDNNAGEYGDTYEVALRYAGDFEGVEVAVGGGYSFSSLEAAQTVAYIDADGDAVQDAGEAVLSRDDEQSWNVGLDLGIGAFGLGAAYVQDDLGYNNGMDRDTWVVGGDYTNGPWKLGVSYLNQTQELFNTDEIDTDRYTGGVVYTYGPGMTFRGSISYIDNESTTFADAEATSVLLGTQINF